MKRKLILVSIYENGVLKRIEKKYPKDAEDVNQKIKNEVKKRKAEHIYHKITADGKKVTLESPKEKIIIEVVNALWK